MLNPDRVELVRLRLELNKTGFADLLGIDRKTLHRFEKGGHDLPDTAIEKLVAASGYPLSFFGMISPEMPNSDAVSFRSQRSLTARKRDAALAVSALAFELDDWITTQYELPASNVVQADDMLPEMAAMYLRVQWGIGLRPIGNMINLLESQGVRVFSLTEETRHLDAYSFWRNERPYVFLNTLKSCERSRFDAAHELAHLVMHRHTGSSHSDAEREADTFASAFLMPRDDVIARVRRVNTLKDLVEHKKRWGVSVAALAYRLSKLGRISEWHYRGYCIELGKIGREKEIEPLPREASLIWEKILRDLWRRKIPLTRLAENLNVPVHELNSLLFGVATQTAKPIVSDGLHALSANNA